MTIREHRSLFSGAPFALLYGLLWTRSGWPNSNSRFCRLSRRVVREGKMDVVQRGWRLGGYVGSRLALVYALLAALVFYLQVEAYGPWGEIWRPQRLLIAGLLGSGLGALLLAPLLMIIPIGLAWLAGSLAGLLTGLLTWLFTNRRLARTWGMFCFAIPPLLFHTLSELRPNAVIGEHWLNSYWFWVGLPSLISVLIGGWVGEHLAGQSAGMISGQKSVDSIQ
jgi:hypothetical protein